MKVLVVRFSSIGDIVLTTPVVRGLKKQLGTNSCLCSGIFKSTTVSQDCITKTSRSVISILKVLFIVKI